MLTIDSFLSGGGTEIGNILQTKDIQFLSGAGVEIQRLQQASDMTLGII